MTKILRQQGFNLFELIIVLTIMGILVSFAIPMYSSFQSQQRIEASKQKLLDFIRLAKTESARRNVYTALCRSNNLTKTQPRCDKGDNWQTGWMVVAAGILNNKISPFKSNPMTDTVLKVNAEVAMVTINVSTVEEQPLVFLPDGSTNQQGNEAVFSICDPNGNNSLDVVISPVGRVVIEEPASGC